MTMLQKCSILIAVILAGGLAAASPGSPTADKYQTLVARLKRGDTTVNFRELRQAYADSPEYTESYDPDATRAMYEAYRRGDYAGALEDANKLLAAYYLDIDAHQVAYLADRALHVDEEAEFHHRIAHGLIQAILQSGDGKSPETAWVVLSTHEEYIVLQVLGLQPGSQSLMRKGTHSYDVLEPVDPKTNAKVTLYFNIDAPMNHLNKLFSK